jgi:uncharacterized protein
MTHWLLDTGPLVAFFDRGDAYHEWAVQQWSRAPVPFVSCEAVLAEAAYLLQTHAGMPGDKILQLIERNVISIGIQIQEHAGSIARLLRRYADQEMQLADACLVRLSELKRNCVVFTLDRTDFEVYRRFERQVIPLIAPEKRA